MKDDETPTPSVLPAAQPPAGPAPLPSAALLSSPWSVLLRQWAVVTLDDGWLRLLGAGGHGLPPLYSPAHAGSSRLQLAFDVLGGSFVLRRGDEDGASARVEYFTPDGLEWIDLGLTGLDELVDWALDGGLAEAFEGLRWPGWQSETRFLAPDQGVSVYPPLWSEQGQDIALGTRGVTPLLDLVAGHREAAEQLAGVADGEQVELRITD